MHSLVRGFAGLLLAVGLGLARADAGPGPLEVQFRSVAVPQNSVPAIAQDSTGFMWIATSKGLMRYDGYRLRPIEAAGDTTAKRSLGWVQALTPGADGRMWIGTEFLGLVAYDPERDRVDTHAPDGPQAPIRALAQGPDGAVWVGTMGRGLFRYEPAARRYDAQLLRWHGEAESRVLALHAGADGTVWAGHWRGLARRVDGAWQDLALPGLPAQAQGVPVLTLAEDRGGRIWLGTQDGHLGVVEQGQVCWVQALGMPIQALAEGADGRLWLGSKNGLYWVNPASGSIDARLRLDPRRVMGLAGNDISGVLPDAWRALPSDPPLVISGLRVNGQPWEQAHPLQGLALPLPKRTLSVEFAALDYADPSRLRYEYRLEGLDSEWTRIDASARNPSFGPLRPGQYTLQVRATAHQTQWGTGQLRLPITLEPAWWETDWAHIGGGLLTLAALWGWMRWRTRSLRRREAELRVLVDERTAELRELSLTDALTGLRNRRYLELRLDDDLRLCLRRFETPDGEGPGPDADLLLMLLDLDHFKRVNDVHGHAAGDAVLVQLAGRLHQVFRETDSLLRWGGEELLVLARETERREAAELAARVCAAVRDTPFDIGPGETVRVTVSLGFCAFPLDPRHPRLWDWRACLGLADSALYAAKAQGRDGYVGAIRANGLSPREAPDGLDGWRAEARLDAAWSAVGDAVSPA